MKDKSLKKQKQDAVSNQVMLVFAAATVLLWGVSVLSKFLDRGNTFGITLMLTKILAIAAALAAAGLLVWYLIAKKNGKIREDAVVHPGIFALFFAALAACCGILVYNFITGMRLIYIFLPAMAVLFLVFKVYERQFFTFCVTHGIVAYALYRCYCLPFDGHFRLLGVLIAGAVCVFAMALVFLPENRKLKVQLLGSESNKAYLIPLYLVTLCVLAAGFLLGGKAALVLLLSTVAYMVGAAVYFTVKLI